MRREELFASREGEGMGREGGGMGREGGGMGLEELFEAHEEEGT